MTSLSSRLEHLEDRGNGGCETCQGWGPRILRVDWHTGERHASGAPERCPRCGRETLTIEIVEVEDWRNERGRRPV